MSKDDIISRVENAFFFHLFKMSRNRSKSSAVEEKFTTNMTKEKGNSLAPSFGEPPPFQTVLEYEYNEPHMTKMIIPKYTNLLDEAYSDIVKHPDGKLMVSTSNILLIRDPKGSVLSRDPSLDRNPEKIYEYIMSNLFAPQPLIHIRGIRKRVVESKDLEEKGKEIEKGKGKKCMIQKEEEVIDFDFNLELSDLLESDWKRLAHVSRDEETPKAFKDAIQNYASNSNPLKEYVFSEINNLLTWVD